MQSIRVENLQAFTVVVELSTKGQVSSNDHSRRTHLKVTFWRTIQALPAKLSNHVDWCWSDDKNSNQNWTTVKKPWTMVHGKLAWTFQSRMAMCFDATKRSDEMEGHGATTMVPRVNWGVGGREGIWRLQNGHQVTLLSVRLDLALVIPGYQLQILFFNLCKDSLHGQYLVNPLEVKLNNTSRDYITYIFLHAKWWLSYNVVLTCYGSGNDSHITYYK